MRACVRACVRVQHNVCVFLNIDINMIPPRVLETSAHKAFLRKLLLSKAGILLS